MIKPYSYIVLLPKSFPRYIKLESGAYQCIGYYKERPIFIERRDYEEDIWAITDGFGALNKNTFLFDHEPMPSGREEEWLVDHRFKLEDAKSILKELLDLWKKEGVDEIPKEELERSKNTNKKEGD